jgi:hypothetical protein
VSRADGALNRVIPAKAGIHAIPDFAGIHAIPASAGIQLP